MEDDVASDISEKAEVISYERLYQRWEQSNWSATDIDLSADAEHWRSRLDERQKASALWNYALFLVGEEAVARTLTPLVDAAPTHAQSIFLTTQIVDEARHHVFFDRFLREVAGKGEDVESTLRAVDEQLTWGFRRVFQELDDVTSALRRKPRSLPLLAQAVALYHVVIEGMLAIPGQHFIQRYVEHYDILPGFTEGIAHVSRDESRHVAFGVKFLGDLVRSSAECRQAAIELWDKVLPWSAGVFVPPRFDRSYTECFGFTLEEIYAFGLRSFETKIRRIGIDPDEIRLLARQDRSTGYDERAKDLLALVQAGVIGDDTRQPKMTPRSLEVLFKGMALSADVGVARSLGAPVEWRFRDADPWHLAVSDGHVEARPGHAERPALRIDVDSGEWAKIAIGRQDARWALLTRRMKAHGSVGAKAKLARLFPD